MKSLGKKKRTGRGSFGHYFKAHWQLYLMISLPVILLLVFAYAPMYGVLLAFKNYQSVWVSGQPVGRESWPEQFYPFF